MLKLGRLINRTLSLRLSLMAVGATALLLSGALAVMFYYARQALKAEAMHDASQTLEGTVQHIDNVLLSVEQSAGNVYWDVLAHLHQPERMNDYCRYLVEGNPYIVGCAIVFKPYYFEGRELFMAYVHRKGNSIMTNESSDLVTSDSFGSRPYTEQVWYTMPMTTGHAFWIDPLKDEDTEGEALTTFCLPIYDRSQQCVGVLAVDLSIGLLSQIVLAAKPSENGYSTLLARNGSYIVHPDTQKLLHQTVFTQTEHGADPSVREAAEAMVAGEMGVKPFVMDGRKWYVFFKPFQRTEVVGRTDEKLGWSIGVVYPEDDIFGDYNDLLWYVLGIAVVCLLLFFVLCRLVTHRQLLPLRLLTSSAERIAKGNYSEPIPETHRSDEIGQLQNHFQQMQLSLVANMGELETLTTELQERRKVLKKAYAQAQEADRMKTAFLHNMTNQMSGPSGDIKSSVAMLCNHYRDISQQDADIAVAKIQQQSMNIVELLGQLIHAAENETTVEDDKTGKEVADE